jgi:hypothetical protein
MEPCCHLQGTRAAAAASHASIRLQAVSRRCRSCMLARAPGMLTVAHTGTMFDGGLASPVHVPSQVASDASGNFGARVWARTYLAPRRAVGHLPSMLCMRVSNRSPVSCTTRNGHPSSQATKSAHDTTQIQLQRVMRWSQGGGGAVRVDLSAERSPALHRCRNLFRGMQHYSR